MLRIFNAKSLCDVHCYSNISPIINIIYTYIHNKGIQIYIFNNCYKLLSSNSNIILFINRYNFIEVIFNVFINIIITA